MKNKMQSFLRLTLSFLIMVFFMGVLIMAPDISECWAAHGISLDGKLKYNADFKQFGYTSEQARKGVTLVLHDLGSFDKMNPFTLKGSAPAGLDNLIFETLAVGSLDEPFASYGLIAKDIELADDRLSVTYTINENAKFSDGSPVTPEDVQFSLNTMKSESAHPFYQAYLQDIIGSDILDKHRIRFNFARVNRELHMIASQVPIFSKKFYTEHPFDDPSMEPPVGSGPYVIDSVNPGKSINPQFAGRQYLDITKVKHPSPG